MENKMEMGARSQKSEEKKSKQYAVYSMQKTENKQRSYCLLLTAYSLLFLLFTVITGCEQQTEEGGIRKTLSKEGDSASQFSLKLLDGKKFMLGDAKGRPVVINFFASWCHPCRTEAPVLQKVYTKYEDKVVFIGIAIQDNEAKVREYVKEFGVTFPVGIDSSGNIAEAYKIYGIPKTFIIDRAGRFNLIHMGEITEHDLMKGIEKVMK